MTINVGWPSMPPGNTTNGGWGAPSQPGNAPSVDNPTPAPQKASMRMRLETVGDVRRELKRTYIAARNEEISTQTATRLAYLLDLMSRMIERSDLEERIEALESRPALR
ncbi:MAG: hypothetical protein AB7G25_05090 [Sphingomonadaceae bacterium]